MAGRPPGVREGGAAGIPAAPPSSSCAYGFGVACGAHVTSALSTLPVSR